MDEGDVPVTIDADENGVVGTVTAQMSERTSFIVLDQINFRHRYAVSGPAHRRRSPSPRHPHFG